MLKHLRRIVDDIEQTLDVVRPEPCPKERFHQRSQTPRGIVQDMVELFVLAVYIAHDMHCALGEMQQGLKVSDLIHGSVNRGEALRQGTQYRQVLQGKMGRV
jgi:hypothetical protein